MNYGRIIKRDVGNGVGIRVSLFVSGCRNHCKNCFQPETWDFKYGEEFTEDTMNYILELLSKPYINGITVLGGEPMERENQLVLHKILREIKSKYPNKTIWCYTGFTIEELFSTSSRCYSDIISEIVGMIDVLVDGRFDEKLADISLRFRGSSNQRLIDVKETIENKSIVLWEK